MEDEDERDLGADRGGVGRAAEEMVFGPQLDRNGGREGGRVGEDGKVVFGP